MDCKLDTHLIINIAIMIISGGFGGYLNFLHNFDTTDKELQDTNAKIKYILLGIGAAFLVPAFLKMISSNLASSNDNNDYLIFAGFCLIAAIFSRRFISSIGEKILEAAKKAEKTSLDNKQRLEKTQLELSSAKERIEDVKLAVDIKNTEPNINEAETLEQKTFLIDLSNSYVKKTSVPDYSERLKLKAELGRKMGEIIVRNSFSKEELLKESSSEGMLLAIAYAIQLRPERKDLETLKKLASLSPQLYTRYSILVAYDTFARNSLIDKSQVSEIYEIINSLLINADAPLLRKIHETINILSFISPPNERLNRNY